jgi:hypothetical protein
MRILSAELGAFLASFRKANRDHLFSPFHDPALPSFPDLSVSCFFQLIALETDLPAAFPYRAIGSSLLLLIMKVSRFPLEWSQNMNELSAHCWAVSMHEFP